MSQYVILAHETFDYIYSKTGNMLIRYRPNDVVAIIDATKAGKTSEQILGWGGDIPCVASFDEAKSFSPSHLVIGNAPQGGRLDKKSLYEIHAAIEYGCDIINGMHDFLNDNDEMVTFANSNGVNLIDLRRPPNQSHFPKGTWKKRKFPVLLVVGSDCDTGKMTTAWEIYCLLKKRKINVEFLATGQTGILLSGNGVPVDAVKADFMAGEVEHCLDNFSKETELVIVEGQGALNNMFYSGVTLGLLHGSMPDYLIMTHEPGRTMDVANHPIPKLETIMKTYIDLLGVFKTSKFLGINLLTIKLNRNEALNKIESLKAIYNLPVTDLVRFNDSLIIEKILNEIIRWK